MLKTSVQLVPKEALGRRPGIVMVPQTLTIHSTANTATAQNEHDNIANNSPNLQVSFHNVVDDKEAIICIPYNEVAWHAGDGRKVGGGNMSSISLEICEGGDRNTTLKNAVILAVSILKKYGWGVDHLRQHHDWSGKNCPRILRDTDLWGLFVSDIQKELKGAVPLDNKQLNIKSALEYLNLKGQISDVQYWMDNYNKLESVYDLIIKFAEALGYKQMVDIPVVSIPIKSNYYVKDGMHFVEIPIENFKIEYWDKPKKTSSISNYMNLGFFSTGYAEDITLPVANLCADIDVSTVNETTLHSLNEWGKIENGKLYVDCRNNVSKQFVGKSPSTLVVYNDNTANILSLNSLPSNVKYAVSGAPIILNGKDPSWQNVVLLQGWDGSIVRATWHGFLTIKDNKIIYIAIETKTTNCFSLSEVYNKLKGYGFKDVIKLDGGGSAILDIGGKNVMATSENRRINSIGLF